MDAILVEFEQELEDLWLLIDFYEMEKKLLSNFHLSNSDSDILLSQLAKKMTAFRLSKLKYDYNSFIISLYGSFERFIENCLKGYIEQLNGIIEHYSNMPDGVADYHFELSLSLLSNVAKSKYSGPLTKEGIIKNLNDCFQTGNNYSLNKEAFAIHSANYRRELIDDSFKQVGVLDLSNKLIKVEDFRRFLIDLYGLNENEPKLTNVEIFQHIDKLAKLRNWVAHGVEQEILESGILLEILSFIRFYSKTLITVLNEQILALKIEHKGKKLGAITDVFQDGTVVCFRTNGHKLEVGQIVYAQKPDLTLQPFNISSIRIENVNITQVEGPDIEIGALINNKIKKNYKLFILDQ